MSEATEYFALLERTFRRPPIGRANAQQRDLFVQAQAELYRLAQVICAEHRPSLQADLDASRRRVMLYIDERQELTSAHAVVTPSRPHRPVRWSEFWLTPEVDTDPAIAGAQIPTALGLQTVYLHREQIVVVRKVVGI